MIPNIRDRYPNHMRACRLVFLILEHVTEKSPNRCAQQLGLFSILGTMWNLTQ